jgi:hypothetical protein
MSKDPKSELLKQNVADGLLKILDRPVKSGGSLLLLALWTVSKKFSQFS